MADFRSYYQNHARQYAAKLFSGFDSVTKEDLNTIESNVERRECPAFQTLLGFTATTSSTVASYTQISPLICRDSNPQLDDIF